MHANGGQEPDDDEDGSLGEVMISDSNGTFEAQDAAAARPQDGRANEHTEPLAAAEETETATESRTLLDAEDDEEASRAAAAAAQEAAAQRAALESAARRAAPEAELAPDLDAPEDEEDEEPLRALDE